MPNKSGQSITYKDRAQIEVLYLCGCSICNRLLTGMHGGVYDTFGCCLQ